jgi:hypothetical protein
MNFQEDSKDVRYAPRNANRLNALNPIRKCNMTNAIGKHIKNATILIVTDCKNISETDTFGFVARDVGPLIFQPS